MDVVVCKISSCMMASSVAPSLLSNGCLAMRGVHSLATLLKDFTTCHTLLHTRHPAHLAQKLECLRCFLDSKTHNQLEQLTLRCHRQEIMRCSAPLYHLLLLPLLLHRHLGLRRVRRQPRNLALPPAPAALSSSCTPTRPIEQHLHLPPTDNKNIDDIMRHVSKKLPINISCCNGYRGNLHNGSHVSSTVPESLPSFFDRDDLIPFDFVPTLLAPNCLLQCPNAATNLLISQHTIS